MHVIYKVKGYKRYLTSLTTSLVLSTNSLFLICVGPLLSIMKNT
ncbi:hypothetical protein BFV95_3689 [Alteromonas macleodii]|uniref:Uncharacterized protein n=1 Tax=Alteromonas macleodii TaxID=28108 RepID=A0AB36FTV5_ALTMA|nr:hypothetical protein BFV95_3689 [Alteromonas macleodii]